MKMRADANEGLNAISRHGPGGVIVNGVEHTRSTLVAWRGEVEPWNVDAFDDLTAEHFARVAALQPELVLFGSGSRLRFVRPALLKPLLERVMGSDVRLIDSGQKTAAVVAATLEQRDLAAPPGTEAFHRFAVSDDEARFLQVGSRFIGDRLDSAELVAVS